MVSRRHLAQLVAQDREYEQAMESRRQSEEGAIAEFHQQRRGEGGGTGLKSLGMAGFGAGFRGIVIPESPRTAIARRVPVVASALLLAETTAGAHASSTRTLANLHRSILEGTNFQHALSVSETAFCIFKAPIFSIRTRLRTDRW